MWDGTDRRSFKPAVIGMSGLLTASIDSMNATIDKLTAAGLRQNIKVVVGGGIVGDQWTQGKVKADATTM
jgi:5-methyltetrahydrofolate--homocysteine methyltransferase